MSLMTTYARLLRGYSLSDDEQGTHYFLNRHMKKKQKYASN